MAAHQIYTEINTKRPFYLLEIIRLCDAASAANLHLARSKVPKSEVAFRSSFHRQTFPSTEIPQQTELCTQPKHGITFLGAPELRCHPKKTIKNTSVGTAAGTGNTLLHYQPHQPLFRVGATSRERASCSKFTF